MYKTLLLCVTVALLLQGCGKGPYSTHLENTSRDLEVKFEKEYFDTRIEQDDIHKANRIKYVSAGKKAILQAALASLLELGFHINNQDIALGILSGTADKSAPLKIKKILPLNTPTKTPRLPTLEPERVGTIQHPIRHLISIKRS